MRATEADFARAVAKGTCLSGTARRRKKRGSRRLKLHAMSRTMLRAQQKTPGSRYSPGFNAVVSSPARTRTSDKAVNSRLLYQLSYRGMGRRENHIGTLKSILTSAGGQGHERRGERRETQRIAGRL